MNNTAPNVELYACGSNAADYDWTHGVLSNLRSGRKYATGFAMHYYCGSAGDPLQFTAAEWTQQLVQAQKMEDIILRNWSIICAYGMSEQIKLVIDEWGCWHPGGSGPSKGYNLFEQQSTMRDAMVAALTLNIFNRHCDKIRMANVAQLVNNLHALFLAGGKNCIVTPTYHVFDMFKEHQGADCFETVVTDNEQFASSLSVSASRKENKILVTVGNLSCTEDQEFSLSCVGLPITASAKATLISNCDMHAHNTFDAPETVMPVSFTLDSSSPITIPKAGILALELTIEE